MKVLFAVSNDNITTSVVNKYQQKYKEIITSKNVYYFNAIIKELQRDKTYDAIVIGEDLEPISNNNYEAIDKFLLDKLDSISDEASKPTGEDIPIIFICSDRRTKTDQILRKLFSMSIYNALVGNDRSLNIVCNLINKPRSKKEAKKYYQIENDQVDYEPGTNELVSEEQIQSILSYYKKIGQNEKKCVQAFDSIAKQYDDTQLRIIVKFLPMSVKAILETRSPKYQMLMTQGTVLSNGRDARFNVNNNPKKPNDLEFLEKDLEKTNLTEPVVIPSTMNINKPMNKGNIGNRNMNNNSFNNQNMNPNMNSNMNGNINNNQFGMPQQNNINRMPQQNPYNVPQQNSFGTQQPNNINTNNVQPVVNNMQPIQSVQPAQPIQPTQNGNIESLQQPAVEPIKRGRGRPRKVIDENAQIEKVKRGRGRPRKVIKEENIQPIESTENVENTGVQSVNPEMNNIQTPNIENTNINNNTQQLENKNDAPDLFDIDIEKQNTSTNTNTNTNTTEINNIPNTSDINNTQNEINPFNIASQSDPFNSMNSNNDINPFDMASQPDPFKSVEMNNGNNNNVNPFDIGTSNDNINPFDMSDTTSTIDSFNMDSTSDSIDPFNMDSSVDSVSPFDLNDINTTNTADPFNMDTQNNTSNPFDMPTTINNNTNNFDNQSFNNNIAKNGKVVAFVGTTKNGTSFVVNNLAQLLSQNGISTAVIDLTKNKNAYYMFTNNDPRLMQIAATSMQTLVKGMAEGVQVNKNLTVFTAIPDEVQPQTLDINTILKTASNTYEVVLLDCDFTTDAEFFNISNEVYLVQSMDAFTIQPLTKFLSDLKLKNKLDDNKIKVVINKYVKLRKLDERMIIGGMSKYNEPSMTLQRDLFDPNKIQAVIIPFEEQNYAKYVEEIAMCQLSLNGFSQDLLASLEELKNMVYPLVSGNAFNGNQNNNFNNNGYGNSYMNNNQNNNYNNNNYNGYNNYDQKGKKAKKGLFGAFKKDDSAMYQNQPPQQQFSNNVNDTLNKMRNNF